MGTDFSYADLEGRDPAGLDWKRLEDAVLGGQALAVEVSGFGDSDNAGALRQLLGEAGVAAAAAAGTDDRESDGGAHAIHTPGALGLLLAGEGASLLRRRVP